MHKKANIGLRLLFFQRSPYKATPRLVSSNLDFPSKNSSLCLNHVIYAECLLSFLKFGIWYMITENAYTKDSNKDSGH